MARETKIGLLAGLAFIICFAIILANRGRQDPIATQPLSPIGPGITAVNVAQGLPVRAQGQPTPRQASRVSHSPTRKRAAPQRNDRHATMEKVRVASAGGADVVLPGDARRSDGQPSELVDASSALAATTSESSSALTSLFQDQDQDQLQRQRALQERLDARDKRVNAKLRTGAGRIGGAARPPVVSKASTMRSQPSRAASTPSRRYTVKPGDTLTRIATKQYGRGSPSIIDAIFNANRSTLSSPDDLRVGADLVLPAINGVAAASAKPPRAPGTKRSSETRTSPRGGSNFRWYQIRKNDRYVSIARVQLGDANRWREIYELNTDTFPDPQRIRHGVRIKLPVTRTASAARR